jgi:hypothetical protein
MSSYWLTPVDWDGETAVLKKERFQLTPDARRERFVADLQQAHSRFPLLFKANLLPSDEAWEICGVEELPFSLDSGEDIVFRTEEQLPQGKGIAAFLPLSHCGESGLHRMLTAREAELVLSQVQTDPEDTEWLMRIKEWITQGWQLLLLREEG